MSHANLSGFNRMAYGDKIGPSFHRGGCWKEEVNGKRIRKTLRIGPHDWHRFSRRCMKGEPRSHAYHAVARRDRPNSQVAASTITAKLAPEPIQRPGATPSEITMPMPTKPRQVMNIH